MQHPPAPAQTARGEAAGIASRSAANIIDFLVVAAMLGAAYLAYTAFRFLLRPRSFSFPAPSLGLVIVSGAAVAWVYFTVCWALGGRSYGDFVLGLRVVSRRGKHLHLAWAALRAAFCVVVPIGLAWCCVDRRRRSAQDLVLHTSVVYDWPLP